MSLLTVVALVCLVGSRLASGAISDATTTELTVCFSKTHAIFKCTITDNGALADTSGDKFAFTKKGGSHDFKPLSGIDDSDKSASMVRKKYLIEMYKKDMAGTYTCAFQDNSLTTPQKTSKNSEEVEAPAFSSARRIVDSLGLTLLCLIATAFKSQY